MTMNEYQHLAQRTSRKDMSPSDHLMNAMLGLAGETGECCDLVKKRLYQDGRDIAEKLKDELSDVLWYVVEGASAMGWTLDEIAAHNVEKLKKRYPEGFDADRSLNRGMKMTEQEKRERVIKGLECCMNDGCECYKPSNGKCPYYKDDVTASACTDDLVYEIYALLKAQEPRVMALEEINSIQLETDMWIEVFHPIHGTRVKAATGYAMHNGDDDYLYVLGCLQSLDDYRIAEYGITWRCWTSRPTDEQRDATPWIKL